MIYNNSNFNSEEWLEPELIICCSFIHKICFELNLGKLRVFWKLSSIRIWRRWDWSNLILSLKVSGEKRRRISKTELDSNFGHAAWIFRNENQRNLRKSMIMMAFTHSQPNAYKIQAEVCLFYLNAACVSIFFYLVISCHFMSISKLQPNRRRGSRNKILCNIVGSRACRVFSISTKYSNKLDTNQKTKPNVLIAS